MTAPTPYEARVAELESEGMTTSDAQGVADVEFAQKTALTMLAALRDIIAKADKLGHDSPELGKARAALAKAEGRS